MSFLKSAQGRLFLKHSFFKHIVSYIYIVYACSFFIRSSLGNSSEGFFQHCPSELDSKYWGRKHGDQELSIVTRDSPTWVVCVATAWYPQAAVLKVYQCEAKK